MSTAATIRELKNGHEDFEWYPTTEEIIHKIARNIESIRSGYRHGENIKSVLDIGAGDGRVLKGIHAILDGYNSNARVELYAIEKAMFHLSNMPKEITVIGTDFEQQALADKPVGVVFCNPPYSDFLEWTLKIVREASTRWVYLVIPERWRYSVEIKQALDLRSGEVTSLGEFTFENADRQARAKVEVIRIEFSYENQDSFDSVIEDMLPELDVFDMELEEEHTELDSEIFKASQNLVERLVEAYDKDLMSMIDNYRAALKINTRILTEIGVSKSQVLSSIRMKIKSMKDKYWTSLFSEMRTITQRLATKQRAAFLESLKNKVAIDFTANNVYSILIWVSKWANDFFDEQLIELFRTLSTDSCVVKYKSNNRVWTQGDWRYLRSDDRNQPSHYRLEYRIVLSRGGICNSEWSWEREKGNGLQETSFNMLMDIVTAANNLGFPCKDSPRNYQWESNKQNTLLLDNGEPLVAVRAFKNGNMHMHFNPSVMLAINIEAGRLLKWVRNAAEACSEMDLKGNEARKAESIFGSSFRIGTDAGILKLTNASL